MLRKLASNKFILIGLATELVYLTFFSFSSLKKLLGDSSLTLSHDRLYVLVVILLLLALVLYIIGFKVIKQKKVKLKTIILFFLVFNLTLLIIWPIGSNDIFSYIYRGRIISEHQANPYLYSYDNFEYDNFYYLIKNHWGVRPIIYGPAFATIGGGLTFLGGNSLVYNVFLFKLFFILVNCFCAYLIYKIFNDPKAVYLYAWNPLLLFEFALNGHNQVIIIMLLLLGLYFFFNKSDVFYFLLAWVFLVFSMLVKYTTIIFLPLFFLVAVVLLKPTRNKVIFIILSAVTAVAIPLATFSPFWIGAKTFEPLLNFSQSLQVFSSLGPMIFATILTPLFSSYTVALFFALKIGKLIFLAIYTWIIIKIVANYKNIKKADFIKYALLASLALVLFGLNWIMPWYLSTLMLLLIAWLTYKNEFEKTYLLYIVTLYGILFYIFLR